MKIQINQSDIQTIVDIPANEIPAIISGLSGKREAVILEPRTQGNGVLTDWRHVAAICRAGAAARYFKVGQFLSLHSPVWGFIEWEIVRMEEDGFWLVARRPVCAMQFDGEEKERDGKQRNIDGRDDWGSNNPLHCAPHKFLNSDKAAGQWWEASTDFDCPPAEHQELPGFLSGLPQDFLDCVKTVDVEMELPDCDGGGTATQPLRFFLPSRQEIAPDNGKAPFFKLKTLKKDGCIWWLRSPNVGHSYNVYIVNSSGALYGSYAVGASGCVPACRIG